VEGGRGPAKIDTDAPDGTGTAPDCRPGCGDTDLVTDPGDIKPLGDLAWDNGRLTLMDLACSGTDAARIIGCFVPEDASPTKYGGGRRSTGKAVLWGTEEAGGAVLPPGS
jgi:hypothetical protein